MSMVVRVFLVHGGRTLRASVLVARLIIFEKTVWESLAKPMFYFFVLRLKNTAWKLTVHCRNSVFVLVIIMKITAW